MLNQTASSLFIHLPSLVLFHSLNLMKTTTPTLIKPTWSDPPEKPPMSSPTPSPTPSPITALATPVTAQSELVPPRQKIDLSPPLLAMVIIAAAAFLLIAYSHFLSQHLFPPLRRILQQYRRWRCRLRHHHHFPPFPSSDTDSVPLPLPLPFYDSDAGGGFYVYSPYYGLHDSVINTIPLTTYKSSKLDLFEDCAVCLLDFEDGDYMRTLPHCSHSFHVDCIDVWLRAHATCPICRANDFFPRNSPMIPLMSARIRPSFDSVFLAPLPEQLSSEIQPAATEFLVSPSPTRRGILIQSGDHRRDVDLLLKRSYSFSFERRSFASERLSATTPRRRQRHQSFWLKRPSSWRVFPSPSIFRRRSKFPMSESSVSWRYGGGRMLGYTSSRTRMGDPEALISPDRWRN